MRSLWVPTLLLTFAAATEARAELHKAQLVYDSTYCNAADLGPYANLVLTPKRGPDGAVVANDPVHIVSVGLKNYVQFWLNVMIKVGDAKTGDVTVCVGLYNDLDPKKGTPSPNAFASKNRYIMVGTRMLEQVTRSGFNNNQEAGLLYVMAHEFAHYLQFENKIRFDTSKTVKTLELHADCSAGFLLTVTGFKNSNLPINDTTFPRMKEMASSLGDDQIAHPQHHGTQQERADAIGRGYVFGAVTKGIATWFDGKLEEIPQRPTSMSLMDSCAVYYPYIGSKK